MKVVQTLVLMSLFSLMCYIHAKDLQKTLKMFSKSLEGSNMIVMAASCKQ